MYVFYLACVWAVPLKFINSFAMHKLKPKLTNKLRNSKYLQQNKRRPVISTAPQHAPLIKNVVII